MSVMLTRRAFSAGIITAASAVSFPARQAQADGFPVTDQRIALVVGNWKYKSVGCNASSGQCLLNSPEIDAKGMAAALGRLGYIVQTLFNTDYETLKKAIADFSRRSPLSNTAVMYYSGHGMQFENTNYLIPVNAVVTVPDDIEYNLVPIDWAVDAVRSADSVGVMILDACRENPFVSALRKIPVSRHDVYKSGLAPIEPSDYFLVSYATGANQVAQDGAPHQPSPYAQAMLAQIEAPDLTIQDIFARVVTSVCDLTAPAAVPGGNGPYPACQRPAVYTTLGAEPVFLKERPDRKATISPSPVLVDIKMADPADPATNKILGENNSEFGFQYFWEPPAEDRVDAQITPNLDYFLSAEDRGRPLIIAKDVGYYAPVEGSTHWSLSYPILDLIARKIVNEPVQIAALVVEAQSSRADNTPYLDLVTPGKDVGLITLVNQSWQKIKVATLEFDIVGRKYMTDDEVKDYINKRPEGPFMISVTVNNIDDSKDVSLVDAIKPQYPDIVRFVFASDKDIKFDKSGRMTVAEWGSKLKVVKLPRGFEEWYATVRSEFEQGDVDPLWIAGRLAAVGENGEKSVADFGAAIHVFLPGVGGGTVDYDLLDYVALPIDGKEHTFIKAINMTLRQDKQTFRGLFPLTARQTSFHRLRFSLKDPKGELLFQSPWADTHIVVSRNDKVAALGKRWAKY